MGCVGSGHTKWTHGQLWPRDRNSAVLVLVLKQLALSLVLVLLQLVLTTTLAFLGLCDDYEPASTGRVFTPVRQEKRPGTSSSVLSLPVLDPRVGCFLDDHPPSRFAYGQHEAITPVAEETNKDTLALFPVTV